MLVIAKLFLLLLVYIFFLVTAKGGGAMIMRDTCGKS